MLPVGQSLLRHLVAIKSALSATMVSLSIVNHYEEPLQLTLLAYRFVYLFTDHYMAFKSVLRVFLEDFTG
jgi:hypothetical protein